MLSEKRSSYNPYFLIPFVMWIVAGGILLDVFSKEELFYGINLHYTHFADILMYYMTWLGEGWLIVIMLLILFAIARFRNLWFFITALLCNLIPFFIQQWLKEFFKAPRPRAYFNDSPLMHYLPQWPSLVNNSFPSGHSEGAFSFFCFLSLLLPQRYSKFGFLFFLMALCVCYSRIYLTAHFFEDVYVGSIIGGGCTTIIYAIMNLYQDRFTNKKDTV